MTTKLFRRPPRKRGPQAPRGDILLESPPDMPDPQPKSIGQYLMVLPMLAGACAMALMMMRRGGGAGGGIDPLMMAVGAMFGVSMLGMFLSNIGGNKGQKKAEFNAERRDYMRYLNQVRRRARKGAERQWRAARWRHPDPQALWSLVGSRRMWERRNKDDDSFDVRVGVGKQRMTMKLVPPETKPVEDLEPMSSMALRRFVAAHSNVMNIPRSLRYTEAGRHVLRGDRALVMDNLRSQLCQLAVLHSPDDVMVAVVADADRMAEWHWTKWLPHLQHPSDEDGAGPVRMFYNSTSQLESALRDQFTGRAAWSPGATAGEDESHLVVILDGGDVDPTGLIAADGMAGVTVFDFSGYLPRKPGPQIKLLDITEDEIRSDQAGRRRVLGRPDRLSYNQAEGIARSLAPWRLTLKGAGGSTESGDEDASPMSAPSNLPEMLGFNDAAALDPAVHWREKAVKDYLKVPIGPGPDGSVVDIDFKESAAGGMGPHGLLIGATGSGKSEVLRTIVGSMIATHSSEELNFILVDFKGGATFASLDELPHVSAVITNLADEIELVDRMADALEGELVRRQEVLRSTGNYTNRWEYEKARAAGQPLDPMPTLMIIADEFSEMLVAKPEFINLFLQIGRIGRSIGVHMLLASQRLEEGKLKGLDTFLSYRVALRTFSAQESRTVIGTGAAYELPQQPGHGYLQVGTEELVRFRAAYVGGAYKPPKQQVSRAERIAAVQHKVQRFLPGHVELPPEPEPEEEPEEDEAEAEAEEENEDEKLSELEVMVNNCIGMGRPAHQVWLPPLTEPPTLDRLLPNLEPDPVRGLTPKGFSLNGKLNAVLGEEDRPFEQRRSPFIVDLSGGQGTVAIAGGAQSGKSTMLRTMMGSMALTHTPKEIQFYCLDFGGGTLRGIEDLPHVAGVFGRQEEEGVRRTIQEVTSILNEREAFFTANKIDGMHAYRRMKADGRFPDDPYGDVFLVVDNWMTLREDYEPFVDQIRTIGNRGLSYGVHVIVTCARWGDIRMNMRDMFGLKLELKLSDNMESEVDRKAQANVPKGRPGRGLSTNKLHFLSGVPRIDGNMDGDDLSPGVEDFVKKVKQAWPGPPCPPVRLLPRELHVDQFLQAVDRSKPGIPIGLNEAGLKPVTLDFEAESHLLVLGDTECGKTNLLRHIARQIQATYAGDEAKVIMADFRRGMLEEIGKPTLLDYAMNSKQFETACKRLKGPIENRLPGDDVSAAQLRDRTWWTGPDLYLIVDDYEMVSQGRSGPLTSLAELIPQGRDIGFHMILARRCAGAGRSMMDPVMGQIKQLENPGLLMSGKREEGAIFGKLRPSPQPPGRGTLVRRKDGEQLIQTALLPPNGQG
ncbi:type VII secretion protein EccCa [Glycomyces xiaoerkulensis]|uniref:type VII secretion protein EccCa n=1 Tax=Glycomyces xiaoerkulensis TaxID=2038139 RepID=UPI000C25C5FD|nr:type VII secretion protein EccCa [Glycomyces xiaoerkulensis]